LRGVSACQKDVLTSIAFRSLPSGTGVACQEGKEWKMKKLFPALMMIALLSTGCVAKDGIKQVMPDQIGSFVEESASVVGEAGKELLKPKYGFLYALIAIELNTNASSLFIDKTKEKIVTYQSSVAKKLTPGSFFFVIPPRVSNGETHEYDEDMGRRIRNYLTLAKYGVPVSSPNDAEYIVVTNIRESLSKTYGTNYSEIALSIVDKFDIPAYTAFVRVESKSDRNFWYYATKSAKPVDRLTMKGMTHIMAEGMPKAHGDLSLLQKVAKRFNNKDKVEN